jgi:hypothetical protein
LFAHLWLTYPRDNASIPSLEAADHQEGVMKLPMALLVSAVAGIVPALAQTSTPTPTGAQPSNRSESDTRSSGTSGSSSAKPTNSDPATTVTYRGTGSGYQPMGAGGYNPMGHK